MEKNEFYSYEPSITIRKEGSKLLLYFYNSVFMIDNINIAFLKKIISYPIKINFSCKRSCVERVLKIFKDDNTKAILKRNNSTSYEVLLLKDNVLENEEINPKVKIKK